MIMEKFPLNTAIRTADEAKTLILKADRDELYEKLPWDRPINKSEIGGDKFAYFLKYESLPDDQRTISNAWFDYHNIPSENRQYSQFKGEAWYVIAREFFWKERVIAKKVYYSQIASDRIRERMVKSAERMQDCLEKLQDIQMDILNAQSKEDVKSFAAKVLKLREFQDVVTMGFKAFALVHSVGLGGSKSMKAGDGMGEPSKDAPVYNQFVVNVPSLIATKRRTKSDAPIDVDRIE